MIPVLKDIPYSERLLKLGLPSLEYKRLRADMIQVYRILSQIDKIDPSLFFQMVSNDAVTRGNSKKIYKQRNRTSSRSSVFSQRVVDRWNSLPNNVVNATSLNSFKSNLNKFWYGHPLKFNPSCYQSYVQPGTNSVNIWTNQDASQKQNCLQRCRTT